VFCPQSEFVSLLRFWGKREDYFLTHFK